MAAKKAAAPAWRLALAKWGYNKSYFPQIGLMRDDTLFETKEVKEAITRLPADVYDERIFRISRALHLSNTKSILPKEEWTKFEDDVHYLTPYLEEIQRDHAEQIAWGKK